MGFLNPLFLAGLAGAAIPVLIHLWSRRRMRIVEVSTLRFLRTVHRQTIRRLQIEQWLILAVRAGAIAAVALGLARPILHSGPLFADARGRSSVAIVLDVSASMAYQGVDGVPFRRAQQMAVEVLRSLRPGDLATVVLAAEQPHVLFDPATPQIGDVVQAILTVSPTAEGTRLRPALERARDILIRSETPNKELYLLSDLAVHGWETAPLSTDGVHVVLVPVRASGTANVGIVGLRVREPLPAAGLPLTLEVTLQNYGSGVVRGRRVQIRAGETVLAARTVDLPPQTTVTEPFPIAFDAAGLHVVTAVLEEDRFPFDDRFAAVIRVLGQIDATVIGERPEFLRLALDPYRLETPQLAYTIRAVSVRPDEALRYALDQPDLLVVQDPDPGRSRLMSALQNRLLAGKPILLFLGKRAAEGELPPWLPIRGEGLRQADPPRTIRPTVRLAPAASVVSDFSGAQAVFGVFPTDFFAQPTAPRVRQYLALRRTDPTAAEIAHLDDGTPFIIAHRVRQGRLVLVNTPLWDGSWSDLPTHPAVVPLLQQLALYAVAPVQEPNRSVRVGAPYRLPVRPGDPEVLQVLRPDGQAERVGRSEDGSAFVYTHTDQLGVYQVRLGVRNEAFAVHGNPAEGDLRPIDRQTAQETLGEAAVWLDTVSADLKGAQRQLRRNGVELWGFFLLLGMVLLLVDTLLSNRPQEAAEQHS